MYGSGSNTKAILIVDSQGAVHGLRDPLPEGPERGCHSSRWLAVAMDELGVVGLSPQGIKPLASFPTTTRSAISASPDSTYGIAAGPNGSIYLDTFYGNGYGDKSALIRINPEDSFAALGAVSVAGRQGAMPRATRSSQMKHDGDKLIRVRP